MEGFMSVLNRISAFLLAALMVLTQKLGITGIDFDKLFPFLEPTEVVSVSDDMTCEIKEGVLTVKLKANAGTGFEWTAEITKGDCVKLVSSDIVSEDRGMALAGGPVSYNFVFEAVKDGKAEIAFTFARSWEENEFDKTEILKVEVTNGSIAVEQ